MTASLVCAEQEGGGGWVGVWGGVCGYTTLYTGGAEAGGVCTTRAALVGPLGVLNVLRDTVLMALS